MTPRAVGAGTDGPFASLGKPLLQALQRFLTGAVAVIGCAAAAELDRVIPLVKALQTVLENDLLLEPEVVARGRRHGKYVSNLALRR